MRLRNLFDYLDWMDDVPFSVKPPNAIDMLVLSQVAHAPLERLEEAGIGYEGKRLWTLKETVWPDGEDNFDTSRIVGPERKRIWDHISKGTRFGEARLMRFSCECDTSESEAAKQFAAVAFRAGHRDLVAFRGTDSTIHGWREDFNMGLDSPVPAQLLAKGFLEKSATRRKMTVCGHSKGGNLALYSAVMCNPALRDRIEKVYSFDGPGVSDFVQASNAWKDMEDRIVSIIPECSVIGLLLGYCKNYRVIQSDGSGLNQHNPFLWHVNGADFEDADELDFKARMVCKAMHTFLDGCTIEERAGLIETLFEMVKVANPDKVTDLPRCVAAKWPQLNAMFVALPDDRKILMRKMLSKALAASGDAFVKTVAEDVGTFGKKVLGFLGIGQGRKERTPLIGQPL